MSNIFTKSAIESKTIVAAFVTVLASVLSLLGYSIGTEDQAMIVGIVTSLVTAVGGALAIYGRVKATKAITRTGE